MKKKSFIAGMITMLLIVSLVGTALATTGTVSQELEYRDIKVTLDGEQLDLRDAQGNLVEPFMFNGTNYLPVRALAESLGLEVSWDGSTNTVVLTTPQNEEANIEELIGVNNSVRFYYTGIKENGSGGYDIQIRCENDSDYTIFAYTRDFTINGKSIYYNMNDPAYTYGCTVEPGRSSDAVIAVNGSALEDNGINEISRFSVRFAGYDKGQSGWSFETGGKTINVK